MRNAHCLFMMALGYLGKGNTEKAEDYFDQVLSLDKNHQGAIQIPQTVL